MDRGLENVDGAGVLGNESNEIVKENEDHAMEVSKEVKIDPRSKIEKDSRGHDATPPN